MGIIEKILSDLRPEVDFTQSVDFIGEGYLDSFDLITLITKLETKFDIFIDSLDIVPENFCSLQSIANVVRKNGASLS